MAGTAAWTPVAPAAITVSALTAGAYCAIRLLKLLVRVVCEKLRNREPPKVELNMTRAMATGISGGGRVFWTATIC